jgi:hypothetical protein
MVGSGFVMYGLSKGTIGMSLFLTSLNFNDVLWYGFGAVSVLQIFAYGYLVMLTGVCWV